MKYLDMIKQLLNKIKDIIFMLKMRQYKKKADKIAVMTNVQQFIIMLNNKISIVDKKWFTDNRQHGVFPKNYTATELKKTAYYFTKK